jgi:hypothetical protein
MQLSRVVYETLIVPEIVEVLSEFYKTQTFIDVYTQGILWSLS